MPRVALVIVNWNGAAHLPGCLAALAAQTYHDYALWVVDNGSSDESVPLLEALGPALPVPDTLSGAGTPSRPVSSLALTLQKQPTNLGFAAGNNVALRDILYKSDCPLIVTLNNDTVAHPGWLQALVAGAEAGGPHCGMVASTMVYASHPTVVQSAGIVLHRDGVALDARGGAALDRVPHAALVPVFGPSAGAALYRRTLLLDCGLFDPRFGSYLEDVDLAWRARLAGWTAGWAPGAIVRHAVSATGGHNSPFKNYHLARNRIWTLAKNLPPTLLRRWAWPILRYDLGACLYGLLRRDPSILRGRRDALRGLAPFLQDRHRLLANRRLGDAALAALIAPSLSPRAALQARRAVTARLAQHER